MIQNIIFITIVSLLCTLSTSSGQDSTGDISNNPVSNDAKSSSIDDDSMNRLGIQKRAEEVPNYGFLNDEEPDYNNMIDYGNDGNQWTDEESKRSSMSQVSDPMRTCMLYATHLLNLICETDNWMVSSYYRISGKLK
jgi:hypothetical protein